MKTAIALALLLLSMLGAVAGCDVFTPPRPPLEFTPSRPALEFSPATLPDAQVGVAYSATITVTQAATPVGGASTDPATLPDGLVLTLSEAHDNTITLAGAPKKAGTYTFTVSVWCYGTNVSGQTATKDYTLVVR